MDGPSHESMLRMSICAIEIIEIHFSTSTHFKVFQTFVQVEPMIRIQSVFFFASVESVDIRLIRLIRHFVERAKSSTLGRLGLQPSTTSTQQGASYRLWYKLSSSPWCAKGVTDLEEQIFDICFYFWHSLTLLQAKPVPCKSCVVLPFCPFGMSRHQLKHAKIESSSLFKVHVQRNCLRTTSGHIGSNGLSKQFGISLQTMGKSWGAYFGNTTLHEVWVWSKSLQSKTLFDWLIDWWLFRFRWVDSTQEDWVLVQDCAGKTASSNGMKSHIHCLHGFCTQVCFCLFWFVMGRFCCLALTYLGSNLTATEIATVFMIGMPCAIRCQVGEDDQDDPCTPHGKLFELVEDELPDVAEEVRKQLKELPGRFLATPNHPMQKTGWQWWHPGDKTALQAESQL